MFEKQVTALTAILKDTDIQSYAGDGFWNIVKAVSLGDAGALLDSANDIKIWLFMHLRYCFGTKCRDICLAPLGIIVSK